MSDGLSVSMMSVNRHFNEPTILSRRIAFEQMVDWRQMQQLQPYCNMPLLATTATNKIMLLTNAVPASVLTRNANALSIDIVSIEMEGRRGEGSRGEIGPGDLCRPTVADSRVCCYHHLHDPQSAGGCHEAT
jgi:hypothetical protein